MTEQASFTLRNRNPDVLTCIANLSNDEVFTPPELANQMLDMLAEAWAKDHKGENIWENKDVKFLDPCTKSGVFLREITARLTQCLEKKIPNLERRVDHILSKQIYGIGITKLTSLLARRSVYCSKDAHGEHSIAKSLKTKDGNIWYKRLEHTWNDAKCVYCGAPKTLLDRESDVENYAYAFVHADNIKKKIKEIFGENMQFDVIIGNPPYQMNTGGGTGTQQATPIYHEFVRQAKALEPKVIVMIIPSRWFSGGMASLESFRSEMLNDNRVREIVDFPDSRDAFNGVDVAGGVNYFLWDSSYSGKCKVTTISGSDANVSIRELNAFPVFIRDNRAITIIDKVIKSKNFNSLTNLVSAVSPFGLSTSFRGDDSKKNLKNPIVVRSTAGRSWADFEVIKKNPELVSKWKVLLSATASEHAGQADKNGTKRVFSRIEILEPGTAVTHSYLILGPLESENQCKNLSNYLRTKFVRFLVSQIVSTQHISKSNFIFVPEIDFNKVNSDENLYQTFNLSRSETDYIETLIRPLKDLDGGENE